MSYYCLFIPKNGVTILIATLSPGYSSSDKSTKKNDVLKQYFHRTGKPVNKTVPPRGQHCENDPTRNTNYNCLFYNPLYKQFLLLSILIVFRKRFICLFQN